MTENSAQSGDTPATARVDVQDPLPETDWFWRRTYTFVFTLISTAFIWYGLEALWNLKQPESIYFVTRYMIFVHVMLITYYMVAPSAEQIIKIVQAAKIIRSGIPMTRSASVETEGTRTEVTTTAGTSEAPQAAPEPAPAPAPTGIDNVPEEAPWK